MIKIGSIANRFPTLVISKPFDICHLTGIKKGAKVSIYPDIDLIKHKMLPTLQNWPNNA